FRKLLPRPFFPAESSRPVPRGLPNRLLCRTRLIPKLFLRRLHPEVVNQTGSADHRSRTRRRNPEQRSHYSHIGELFAVLWRREHPLPEAKDSVSFVRCLRRKWFAVCPRHPVQWSTFRTGLSRAKRYRYGQRDS